MAEPIGILGTIVAAKRQELAGRLAGVSIDSLRSRAVPTRLSLARALARPGARFVFEIKKASPSEGAIRKHADVAALALGYQGVADALSVLTDPTYFSGSLADLATARRAFDGPILAKDFFVDPRQVVEARIAGADAVLIMLSVLDDGRARRMIEEARRLGMDALVEVHDEAELRRAIALDAPLLGINNRDLRDLSVDLGTTERLAPLVRGRVVVAESGITARADVARLAPHVDAFLVGSAMMKAADPGSAARHLAFGRVKLCGLNRQEDVTAGAAATFAGFVFAPGSPRHITANCAAPLAGAARKRGIKPVGIFRNAPLDMAVDVATLLNLHAVQLHGCEDADYIRALRRELPAACELWTAVTVGRDIPSARCGDRMLFDSGPGGTGRCFDWRLAAGHPQLRHGLIAGGIGPGNARAAARLGAYALDVGSAVDALPGLKSPAKIAALFDALRAPSRQEQSACA